MPLSLASLSAKFFQLFPNPLLTEDQLRLLKYDNVASGKYKTNFDIGVPSLKIFDQEAKSNLNKMNASAEILYKNFKKII